MRPDGGHLRERNRGPGRAVALGREVDRDPRDVLRVAAELARQTQHDVVEFLPLDHLRKRPAADCHLHDALDVGDAKPVPGARLAIEGDLQVWLAKDAEHADVHDAIDPPQRRRHGIANLLQRGQVAPEHLDRIGALHAGECLLDVVADQLREIEVESGELGKLMLQLRLDLFPRHARPPLVHGLERHVEFQVEVARHVGAVVGTAHMRHHAADLRDIGDHRPEPGRHPRGSLERRGPRHQGPNPEIALLKRRHELHAQTRYEGGGERHQPKHSGQHGIAGGECRLQHRAEHGLEEVVDDGFLLLPLVAEEEGAEHGRERDGQDQRPANRQRIGVGHRAEQGTSRPRHEEQRQEGADDDGGREEEWPLDLRSGRQDPVVEGAVAIAMAGDVPVDVFDDDHGTVDDDAEVDCADRQ